MTISGVFVVATEAQRILFVEELCGQISDGHWENTPGNHWQVWCNALVVVGPNPGRSFYATKSNYNFAAKELLDVVGDRMIEYVRSGTGDQSYGWTELRRDLQALKQHARHFLTELTPEQARTLTEAKAAEEARRIAAQADRVRVATEINELAKEQGLSIYASDSGSVTIGAVTLLGLLRTAAAFKVVTA